ncbi:hypothetical protein ACSSS7_002638 [Eimeria intestinalis]
MAGLGPHTEIEVLPIPADRLKEARGFFVYSEDGLAHVIEEGEDFKRSFGREVVLGMLGLEQTERPFREHKLYMANVQRLKKDYTAFDWVQMQDEPPASARGAPYDIDRSGSLSICLLREALRWGPLFACIGIDCMASSLSVLLLLLLFLAAVVVVAVAAAAPAFTKNEQQQQQQQQSYAAALPAAPAAAAVAAAAAASSMMKYLLLLLFFCCSLDVSPSSSAHDD